MRIGTVTGAVWATKKAPRLSGQILLRVRVDGAELVAADLVGAGVGERVLVVHGAAARQECDAPVDAAILAILDDMEDFNVDR